MGEYNPWDKTIWDPFDSEYAIEDPMHGPSATHGMIQTPAMPDGNGTYYQPGASYICGTAYLDSQNRPVLRIGSSLMDGMREGFDLREWITAYHEGGDDALTELEAGRQQARLVETGFAHCFKASDVCPGGKRLEDCETGSAAYAAAREWADTHDEERPGSGTVSNALLWAAGKCAACSVSCEAAIKTVDGKPQEIRVSFYEPDPDTPFMVLDLTSIIMSPTPASDLDKIRLAREFYEDM